jgi:hypothetical protein
MHNTWYFATGRDAPNNPINDPCASNPDPFPIPFISSPPEFPFGTVSIPAKRFVDRDPYHVGTAAIILCEADPNCYKQQGLTDIANHCGTSLFCYLMHIDEVSLCVPILSWPPVVSECVAELEPVYAICQNMTAVAGSNCTAVASIDNGSNCPGSAVCALAQNPPGPYQLGSTNVTLTATNEVGALNQCSASVTVVDNTPPTITNAFAIPNVLWPPNHKMVNVKVNYTAADNCEQATCHISNVTSNETISSSDYAIADAHHVLLSAERLGTGNGRMYTITVSCTDGSGNSATRTVTVSVPHDRGN